MLSMKAEEDGILGAIAHSKQGFLALSYCKDAQCVIQGYFRKRMTKDKRERPANRRAFTTHLLFESNQSFQSRDLGMLQREAGIACFELLQELLTLLHLVCEQQG